MPLLNCWRSRIEVVLEVETRDVKYFEHENEAL